MSGKRGKYKLVAKRQTPERDAARFWAKVDKQGADGCWLWTAAAAHGYGSFGLKVGDKWHTRRAHRYSYELANGPIPNGLVIDHLCHVGLCVNPSHLRATTQQQNMENRRGANSDSKTGIRNVFWSQSINRWRVTATRQGKTHWGGNFVNLEDATAAAEALRERLYSSPAVTLTA